MKGMIAKTTKSGKLVIIVDLNKSHGYTKSFAGVSVANSGGPVQVVELGGKPDERGIRWSFFAYRPFLDRDERRAAEEARREELV